MELFGEEKDNGSISYGALEKANKGTLLIDFRDGRTVSIKEGEVIIIPKGVEHRPHTNGELVLNLLFEPKSTQHTGNIETDRTVKKLDWI